MNYHPPVTVNCIMNKINSSVCSVDGQLQCASSPLEFQPSGMGGKLSDALDGCIF
jgi:hypothetical protein